MITNNILLLMKSNFFPLCTLINNTKNQINLFKGTKKRGKGERKKIFLSLSLYAPVLW